MIGRVAIVELSTETFCRKFVDLVFQAYQESVERHGKFFVAVSGGSMSKQLCQTSLLESTDIDWSKWVVAFADERCVPLDHKDSNYSLWKRDLFDKVPIPAENILTINAELAEDPKACAEDYQRQILSTVPLHSSGYPYFDLLLLGMGPDGHTCSLFPTHPLLESKQAVDYILDSPKPPPRRITLTLPVVHDAEQVLFAVAGRDKAPAVAYVFGNNLPQHPAGLALGKYTKTTWLLDEEAASMLPNY